MGPADAVALYHGVSKVRKDAFFFANDLFVYLLGAFDNMMAPVVWDQEGQIHKATKKTIERMKTFFFEEIIGILFPSGRLSKFTFFGLKERYWQKTPLSIADRHDCLLVPAYIVGRNSWFFYFASVINKRTMSFYQQCRLELISNHAYLRCSMEFFANIFLLDQKM
jgi:putative hemolysin